MGNKSSAPLPPVAAIQKRFSPEELQRLGNNGDDASSTGGRPLTKEDFMNTFGKGLGPAMRRVLVRLFLVLDANGSGALEYEEYLAAAFFFTKATSAERLRVLFSMYESPATTPTASSSSSCSSSLGYLSKNDVAAICADTTFALAEILPSPPSILKQLGADGGGSGKKRAGGSKGEQAAMGAHVDATSSPFKELTSVMVDVAFAKYDVDRDGRLSVPEFLQFAQHADSGVDAVMQSLLSTPHARHLWSPASGGS